MKMPRGSVCYVRVKVLGPYRVSGLPASPDQNSDKVDVQCVDRMGRPTDMVIHVLEEHQLITQYQAKKAVTG